MRTPDEVEGVRLLILAKRREGVEPTVIDFETWLTITESERYDKRWIVVQRKTWDRWNEQRSDI